MSEIQLAVLFGGRACEHDVSIITALQCMEQIDSSKYRVIPIYVAADGAWYTGEKLRDIAFLRKFDASAVTRVYPDVTANSHALLYAPKKKSLFGREEGLQVYCRPDVALLAFHGMHGEDGSVQGLLELMNIPYTSAGVTGSAVGMDKIAMRMLFKGCGFPVLDMEWFTRDEWERQSDAIIARLIKALPFPMYVKPANLGSSIGISRATDERSLRDAIEVAIQYDRRILVERGVDKPREVNCSVMGFSDTVETSVCEMPTRWEEFLTFDEKYLRGAKNAKGSGNGSKAGSAGDGMAHLSRQIPAPIPDETTALIRSLSEKVFRALDCKGVVRIDFLLEGDKVFVNEINTIPGSLSFYLWEPMGISYPRLIDRLVDFAFRAHEEKNRNNFAFDSAILQSCSLGGTKGAKGTKN